MPLAAADLKKPVGQILIERGLITQPQLEQALIEQKRGLHRRLLGETIVEMGFCSEDQVLEALAAAYGMPYAKLTSRLLDPRVLDALPRDFMEEHGVIPLFKVDGVLTVAVHEPANVFLVEERTQVAGGPVQLVAATARDIHGMLETVQVDADAVAIDDLVEDASSGALGTSFGGSLDIAEIADETGGSPVVKLANAVISSAVREGASDIHIEPDENLLRVRYRIDGRLVEKIRPPTHLAAPLSSRIKIMASLDISERRLPQDGAIHVKLDGRPIDIRVSTLPNKQGEKLVLRIIDNKNVVVSLEQLGFDKHTLELFRRQIHQPHGMMLVTGPTGSGKSTTLYAALKEINSTEINICTVEDPIEFNLLGVNQFQVNEKIGFTFAGTLRSLLRQDPDVIMVGEIRDQETARIAVQASLTGHMVFTSLHTNDAPAAVTRLYNLGVEPYLISASLVGVLGQRLVRKLCPHCSEESPPPANLAHAAEQLGQPITKVFVAQGCSKCRQQGFSGRLGVFEMLVPDDEMRDAITGGANLNQLRKKARDSGMTSLLQDGFDKVRQGLTTIEEVLRVTAT